MARAKLTKPANDLISDSGAVLWSFIKGEQLEFPITISFIPDAGAGYIYEAVVIEAYNIPGQSAPPTTVKAGGVQNTLVVRVPSMIGVWDAGSAYTQAEVVSYNGKYYELKRGIARTNATTPDLDNLWTETILNKIYVQFPSTLGSTWEVPPSVGCPSYGFFELRVTEPANPVYQKTWKPVRGMVEVLFSPTDTVPG